MVTLSDQDIIRLGILQWKKLNKMSSSRDPVKKIQICKSRNQERYNQTKVSQKKAKIVILISQKVKPQGKIFIADIE